MKLTNKYNLPDYVYRALANDTYDKVGDYSVTDLLKPPRLLFLKKRHDDEITMDVSEMAFALLGTGVHSALEVSGEGWITEERMILDIGGVKLSGKADNINATDGHIYDNKCTSVWSYIYGDKDDWTKQLNSYIYMAKEVLGVDITKASITAIFRDWKMDDRERAEKSSPFGSDYPAAPILEIEIPVLPHAEVGAAIRKKLVMLNRCESLEDDGLPFCTADDRWARGESWAVIKKGAKRALNGGVHDTKESAEEFAAKCSFATDIEHRVAKSIRCERYCPAAPFCNQWAMIKDGINVGG